MSEQFIIDMLIAYRYPILFVGLFIGGDTVFLVALYLSLTGVLTLPGIIGTALLATFLADGLWYWIGTRLTYTTIKKMPYFRKNTHFVDAMEKFFEKHSLRTIMYSKFVYGTRTIVQILSGTHRVSFVKYLIVNTLGTIALILGLTVIGMLVGTSVAQVQSVAHTVEIGFALLIVVVFFINRLVRKKVYGYIEGNR